MDMTKYDILPENIQNNTGGTRLGKEILCVRCKKSFYVLYLFLRIIFT